MTREEKILKMMNQDMEDIRIDIALGKFTIGEVQECDMGDSFLFDILFWGWKGYHDMDDERIDEEYNSRNFER